MPRERRPRCLHLVAALAAAGVVLALAAPAAGAESAPGPGGAASLPFAARLAEITAAAQTADARLAAVQSRENELLAQLGAARARLSQAQSVTFGANQRAEEAKAQLEAKAVELKQVVVSAYIDQGNGDVLASLLSARDTAELGRRRELARRIGAVQERAIDRYRRARVEAERRVQEAAAVRDQLGREVAGSQAQLSPVEQAVAQAQQEDAAARKLFTMWDSVAAGPATPIMGRSVLTGPQLAAWFRSTRSAANATVPIDDLAQMFVDEGAAEGVQGDIAFAQAIVETGYFDFPDFGQDHPDQNNFAGIGACDSCATGRSYPDARSGVRAQIQLLRFYADPTASAATLHNPLADPSFASFGPRGWAPTWAALTGRWATSSTYGDTIFATYARILAWVTDHDPS